MSSSRPWCFALSAVAALNCLAAAADGSALWDFARDEEYSQVKISPTGEYLAATLPLADKTSLAVIRLADRKITGVLHPAGKEHIQQFWWVGPQRVAASAVTKSGSLAQPLWTGEMVGMDADGSKKAYLFGYRGRTDLAGRSNRTYGYARMLDPLPHDPDHALIQVDHAADALEGHTEAFRMHTYTGALKPVARAPMAGYAHFLADHQAEVRYVVVSDLANRLQTFWRQTGGEWQQENTGNLKEANIVPLAFAEDGSSVFVTADDGRGSDCLVERSLVGRDKRRTLTCGLNDVVFSFDGKVPIATVSAPGAPELKFLNTGHPDGRQFAELAKAFKNQFVEWVSATADGSKVVLLAYSDRDPGQFYLLDKKTGSAEYLLSRRAWIDPQQMAVRRPISYKTRDGHTVWGYLTLPSGRKAERLPAVVMPHGGPFGVRDHWIWDADAQALASRGYAVIQVNYRGSDGYGRRHRDAGKRGWGTVMIDDISDGVRWAAKQGHVDPDRLCIFGGSYGGYAAMMSAVREPDLYKCVIGYVGVYDLPALRSDADFARFQSGENYFDEYVGADPEQLRAQSPMHQLARLKAPVFLVHGEQDVRAPFGQAKALRRELEKRNHPLEWLAKSNEGHGFYQEKNRLELYERVVAFLDKHIGDDSGAR